MSKTVIDEMWEALAGYQPQADAQGHGETWAAMCREKTSAAADAAYADVDDAYDATYAAAYANFATFYALDADAIIWAKQAIDLINKAKENT